MKKILLLIATIMVTMFNAWSQTPQTLNYQAVARDNAGHPLPNATAVNVRFHIHDGSLAGTVVYTETISTTTNQFGLVNVQIGSTANLGTVNWGAGTKYLQVETDVNNTGTYTDMGTSQLISVPYALFSGASQNLNGTNNYVVKFTSPGSGGNSQIFDNGKNVGIGNATPKAKLDVEYNTDTVTSSYVLFSDSLGNMAYNPNDNEGLVKIEENGQAYGLYAVKHAADELAVFKKDFVTSGTSTVKITGNMSLGTPTLSVSAANNKVAAYLNGSLTITDGTQAAGAVLTSDAGGNAYWDTTRANPNIGFKATNLSAFGTVAGGTFYPVYITEQFDNGTVYNNTTGVFTVPATGIYSLSATLEFNAFTPYTSGYATFGFEINGGTNYDIVTGTPNTVATWSLNHATIMKLSAGDAVRVRVYNNLATGTLTLAGNQYYAEFSAVKLY